MRNKKRIDYKKLNETGEKVPVEVENQEAEEVAEISSLLRSISISEDLQNIHQEDNMEKQKIDSLKIDESTLAEDVDDFIDENEIDQSSTLEEIDVKINRMEQLRTSYRRLHNELKTLLQESYGDQYGSSYECKLQMIKSFIKNANAVKKDKSEMKSKADVKQKSSKLRSDIFLAQEVKTSMTHLKEVFGVDLDEMNDDEITSRKNDLPKEINKVENLSKKVHNLLECSNPVIENQIDEIVEMYKNINKMKNVYTKAINDEVNEREISKQELFQESKLKINLPKFSGYDSKLDIYTFQSEFMKIYKRTTPKRVMPDILKNNLLEGSALSLVKQVHDIDEIWIRLKSAYGDAKLLLKKKMSEICKINQLWKMKDPEKVVDTLSKIINIMKDLEHLAEEHKIQSKLYYGDGLDRIYQLLGDNRVTRWLSMICEESYDEKELWSQMINFLEKDLKVQQQKVLIQEKVDDKKIRTNNDGKHGRHNAHHTGKTSEIKCYFCDETEDHVATNGPRGTQIVQYFACKKFAEMTPNQRFQELRRKGFCFQCLFPGASQSTGKHSNGKCQRDFTCKHQSHDKYPIKKHVLVCHEHREEADNQQLLEEFKQRCIMKQAQLPAFSKELKLTFHTNQSAAYQHSSQKEESAIYILQTIKIENKEYSLFYDTGCCDMVSRYQAVKAIGARASKEISGPISVGGVGNSQIQTNYGIYKVKLPLFNGSDATFSGVCMDQITVEFPQYPLKGKVEDDIKNGYRKEGKNPQYLPRLPKFVGGHTDFMLGIKYLRYYPEKIFQLPSGLTIYKSWFFNTDGSRGVIGGPHKVFTEIESRYHANSTTFLSEQYQLFKTGYQVNPDASLLHIKMSKDYFNNLMENNDDENRNEAESKNVLLMKSQKMFEEVEYAGSEISYRCEKCRSCKVCKEHDLTEIMSIKEEVEQDAINRSVKVDIEHRRTTALLPLMSNPAVKLAPNKDRALRTYNQQVKKLNQNPQDKKDVIESEAKLQQLGHVEFVKNLTAEQQEMLRNNPIQNFIPWRAVWNGNSISTPCRIVFDASQPTSSGVSLNDILAKGKNNMNKLVEIVIRWSSHKAAFHTDIKKMYNSVQLREEHWCLQRYIWQNELDKGKLPEEKVIKTLIYGIRSSGNQSERGLRQTAKLSAEEYPEVNQIVQRDIYVDDCLSGEESMTKAMQRADQLELVLNRGGFSLKGVTFSGTDPPSKLSKDDSSINVAGMKWLPKDDVVSLDIGELNFAKKQRGKKPIKNQNIIPLRLTRRHCVSKVAEIFDLTGKVTPITATMKMDLHSLVQRKLDWDDTLPDDLRSIWTSHFEMMQEIGKIKYKRAIVPQDAANLDISTIDFGDASNKLACAAIYARFLKKDGTFSCQLVFSRSKIIPDGLSQPRAELFAATINVHTGEIVRRSLQCKERVKLTDSQVVLHWINNHDKPVKQWVRNRVVEINRYTEPSEWMYVSSKDMIADLGTRRVNDINLVDPDSTWINGYDWMKVDVINFPTKSFEEISLGKEELMSLQTENLLKYNQVITDNEEKSVYAINYQLKSQVPKEVQECYQFSKYLLDPNKRRFKTVIRIIGFVFKFINNVQERLKGNLVNSSNYQNIKMVTLSEEEIKASRLYFFKKATAEVKKFVKLSNYQKISVEKNEVLYYTGRILSTSNINSACEMSSTMKDLSATTFQVPLVYKHSPLAYSLVNEVHWYSMAAKHSGVETVWRYVLKTAYIIFGREVVKKIRINCERCRYLRKKVLDVEMGPVSKYNLMIAPAFYATQTDICGPFMAYSSHHKRTTIKIWLIVYCCMSTSTTNIKVMDDYSTQAFIQSFVRFSCEVGYPKYMMVDEGSQLVKGCEDMRLSFIDIRGQLNRDVMIDFDTCPVGGHNFNGKVERRIRHVKESLEKNISNQRLSILQWETISAEISNAINDLPIALGNIVGDFEQMDLITPNRLRLGRNNDRSPVSPMKITGSTQKIIEENKKIFNSWFEAWLTSYVPKLMHQPKWFRSDRDIKICDVVLFTKKEGSISSIYQYGMVHEIEPKKDGLIRRVVVKYRNHNESVDRFTTRAVRELVLIHPIDEVHLMEELGKMSTTDNLVLVMNQIRDIDTLK